MHRDEFTFTMQGQLQNYPFPKGMPPTLGDLVVTNTPGNIDDQQWGSILTSVMSSILRHGPLRCSNLAHLVIDILPQLAYYIDAIPHLTGIMDHVSTPESYGFGYGPNSPGVTVQFAGELRDGVGDEVQLPKWVCGIPAAMSSVLNGAPHWFLGSAGSGTGTFEPPGCGRNLLFHMK